MNDRRVLAAALGFAFVAAWIGFGFGQAALCLLGAAIAWLLVTVLEGKIDLGELQARVSNRDEPSSPPSAQKRPRGRARVQ